MAIKDLSRLPAEHLVDVNGNKYPKYSGILLIAHEEGLTSLTTRIIQVPSKENEYVAIVEATAVMGRGDEARVFTDYGDASPKNCTSRVATAILRMASTRAKGRALRDAIAIGQTLYEEMPEEERTEFRSSTTNVPNRISPTTSPHSPTKPLVTNQNQSKSPTLTETDLEPEFDDPSAVGPHPNQASSSASSPASGESVANRYCSVCKRVLTIPQKAESMAKFGKPLCALCRRNTGG